MTQRRQISDGAAFAIAIGFGVLVVMTTSVIAALPRAAAPVAVFASPWKNNDSDALQIIAAADSRVVSQGRYDWIAVAYDEEPGLTGRLYRAGALFVVDATFASACIRFTQTEFWMKK